MTQLEFVLYKLFKEISLEYPPAMLQENSLEFNSQQTEIRQIQLQIRNKIQTEALNISKEFSEVPELQEIANHEEEKQKYSNLFKDCRYIYIYIYIDFMLEERHQLNRWNYLYCRQEEVYLQKKEE